MPTYDQIEITCSSALFDNMDQAVDACCEAQRKFASMSLSDRKRIIQFLRDATTYFTEDFCLSGLFDSKRGRYEDKIVKHELCVRATPGVEDIQPKVYTGDNGLTTIDLAPMGVIGAITPVTNPTVNVVHNSIMLLAAGNGVVYNPHPNTHISTNRTIAVLNEAIMQAGGPASLICSVKKPSVETGNMMMRHPKIAANLITGGLGVVKAAMQCGKKCYCAGPGNPPVLVDSSADAKKVGKGIYNGASFENNMSCIDEKEVFVVGEDMYKKVMDEMKNCGAHIASCEETKKLESVVFSKPPKDWEHGEVVKDHVGLSAYALAMKAGIDIPKECRLIVCPVEAKHPLVWTEQLMPVLPVVKVNSYKEGLELCKKAEHGFGHTASIYSSNLDHISEMAQTMNTAIFTVNGPHTTGLGNNGEGYTSFSIAGTTGEGLTRPSNFVKERRLVCVDALRFV